jgi:L-lactate dehydrogenase complex protein LldG
MGAREEILGGIRRSLGATGHERPRTDSVAERLDRAPRGVTVERGRLPAKERIDLFERMAAAAAATVARVASPEDIPDAVAAYLRDRNLPPAIRRGADPRLDGLPWDATTLEISRGPSDGSDATSVSHAFAGVAETGTLVLVSGEDNPTTLNFLPDDHVVVLDAADVVADYERVWTLLRGRYGKTEMPRTVNLITGPSRSGDIEQILLMGAHGPRRVHILLVDRGET